MNDMHNNETMYIVDRRSPGTACAFQKFLGLSGTRFRHCSSTSDSFGLRGGMFRPHRPASGQQDVHQPAAQPQVASTDAALASDPVSEPVTEVSAVAGGSGESLWQKMVADKWVYVLLENERKEKLMGQSILLGRSRTHGEIAQRHRLESFAR